MKFFRNISLDFNAAKSFSASIFIHLVIFILAAYAFKISTEKSVAGSSYVQIKTKEIIDNLKNIPIEEKKESTKKFIPEIENNSLERKKNEAKTESNMFLLSDTSGLYQVYKESTLDVSIRYPIGWAYIDQDIKNKLDGVTFWATDSIYSPPPYIHIEVKEKYLFNPGRYQYSIETDNYTAYYNDPEELAGQISQEVYIRTGIDEDFSIKLIMDRMESFRTFQPVFFGMIKTFKFDNSLF